MRKIFVLCLLMIPGINSFAQESRPVSINEAIRSAMVYLTGQIAPNSKIVVLNFSAPTEELSNYIIEDLSGYIVNNRTLTVVDRRNLEVLQQELNFQMSGNVSDETAQAIGKMLGAQSIISGSISLLGRNYRFRVQAVEVETAAIQGVHTVSVVEDATLAALLGSGNVSRSTAAQKFAIGAQAGTLFGLSSYIYDSTGNVVIGIGNFGFLGSLYGAYAFNSVFRLQFGVNIVMNSLRMAINNNNHHTEPYDFNYTSLDIPLMLNTYFNPSSSVLLRIGVGPYTSIGWHDSDGVLRPAITVISGLLGGFGVGYKTGKGNIVLDLRYLSNFLSEDFSNYRFIRRGVTASLGYEHWF